MEKIKAAIRAHLQKTTEANVKQLTRDTGSSETEIINTLNSMRTYGEVECEQQGRGKGMAYWLATPAADKDAELLAQARLVVELREALQKAESQRDAWRAIGALLDCDTPQALITHLEAKNAAIAAKAERVAHLEADLQVKAGVIEQLRDESRKVDGYLVVRNKKAAYGKPMLRYAKRENAISGAKQAAKYDEKPAEVFALTKVGRAVKGVEFKEAA